MPSSRIPGVSPVAQEKVLYPTWHNGPLQVGGKNGVTFQEMIRKDIAYEQERSFKMDLNMFTPFLERFIKRFIIYRVDNIIINDNDYC